MKKLLIAILLMNFAFTVSSQKKIYIGIQGAATNNFYNLASDGNLIKNAPLPSGLWGVLLRKDLNPAFSIETGIIQNYYLEGFGFEIPKQAFKSFSSSELNSLQIPIRLNSKLNLYKNKISFVGTIGLHFAHNQDYFPGDYGSGSGYIVYSNGDSLVYTERDNCSIRKNFMLLETSVGFEFNISQKLQFNVGCSYYTGFNDIIRLDVKYHYGSCTEQLAILQSKGNMIAFNVSLFYPILTDK